MKLINQSIRALPSFSAHKASHLSQLYAPLQQVMGGGWLCGKIYTALDSGTVLTRNWKMGRVSDVPGAEREG